MVRQLDELTKGLWRAAWFIRRAPERNHADAVKVLRRIHNMATGTLRDRAAEILKDYDDDGSTTSA